MPKIVFFLVIILCFLYWGNNNIVISKHLYKSEKVSASLNGFKILHISDFHNKKFGKNSVKLIKKIKKENPNLIVITGDIIDRRNYDLEIAANLCEELIKIAPSYYVSGNHEAWSSKYHEITTVLKEIGVVVLEDEVKEYFVNADKISIYGLKENMEKRGGLSLKSKKLLEDSLKPFSKGEISILLAHRPELFSIYKEFNFDMVFTGHAHGGQIRLPFVGALFAPDQGLFPKYSSGEYKEDDVSMFLSRGLGNSAFPIRLFNRPELILVEFLS